MGIDPGTNLLGYAVLDIAQSRLHVVEIGVIKMAHLFSHQLKLKCIFEKLQTLIERHHPTELAIEAPFFGKNVQSMLKLGRAQGVAMAAGLTKGLIISEYSPKKVKQSITGNGNASKEQVAAMLQHILKVELKAHTFDATDALAVALCHHYQSNRTTGGKKRYSNWSSYLKDHPDKLQ